MEKLKSKNYDTDNILRLRNLTVEELIKIYKNTGSSEILNIILEKTKKLAYKVVSDFKINYCDRKDIRQVALTGLVIAINRFNTGVDTRFSTFAVNYIKGEILHFIRDNRLVKSPRWLWKLNKIFTEYVKKYETQNNSYPTIKEISEGINIPVEGVNEFLKAREAAFYNNRKINDCARGNGNKAEDNLSYDRSLIRSKEYKSFDLVMEDKIILWDAIDRLHKLNKKILVLSYFLGFSQEEIGKKIGISQKSVSRKLKESIKQLKEYFACN